jgi:hypothetical protein
LLTVKNGSVYDALKGFAEDRVKGFIASDIARRAGKGKLDYL